MVERDGLWSGSARERPRAKGGRAARSAVAPYLWSGVMRRSRTYTLKSQVEFYVI